MLLIRIEKTINNITFGGGGAGVKNELIKFSITSVRIIPLLLLDSDLHISYKIILLSLGLL